MPNTHGALGPMPSTGLEVREPKCAIAIDITTIACTKLLILSTSTCPPQKNKAEKKNDKQKPSRPPKNVNGGSKIILLQIPNDTDRTTGHC